MSPSRDNDAFQTSSTTSWIVHFQENHNHVPRVLFLFGCRKRSVSSRLALPYLNSNAVGFSIIAASIPPTCDAVSVALLSTQNPATLTSVKPHMNTHGPHPADNIKFELRSKPSTPAKTKPLITSIRQINAKVQIRCQSVSICVRKSVVETQHPNTNNN